MKKRNILILLSSLLLCSCNNEFYGVPYILALTSNQNLKCEKILHKSKDSPLKLYESETLIEDIVSSKDNPFKDVEKIYQRNESLYLFKSESSFIIQKKDYKKDKYFGYKVDASVVSFGEMGSDYYAYYPIDLIVENQYNATNEEITNYRFREDYLTNHSFSEYVDLYNYLSSITTIDEKNKTITTSLYYQSEMLSGYKLVIHFKENEMWFTADEVTNSYK